MKRREFITLFAAARELALGPRLPTLAVIQVGSYRGYTGHNDYAGQPMTPVSEKNP